MAASVASARLGHVASGCGSKGQLRAAKVHVSDVEMEVKEPADGAAERWSMVNAVSPSDASAVLRAPGAHPSELYSTNERRQRSQGARASYPSAVSTLSAQQHSERPEMLTGVDVLMLPFLTTVAQSVARDGLLTIGAHVYTPVAMMLTTAKAAAQLSSLPCRWQA